MAGSSPSTVTIAAVSPISIGVSAASVMARSVASEEAMASTASRSARPSPDRCSLLLLRHRHRLPAFGHDDGEHLGGLGSAGIGGDGMQLARRLVERLALGEDFFLAL